MKIHIHSIARDEEFILPYFVRHYNTFAEKIFIMYKTSRDGTWEVLQKLARENPKVEVIDLHFDAFDGKREIENTNISLMVESYKKWSRGIADWVMCVDPDEFMYNPDMINTMINNTNAGKRVIKTTGYHMISNDLPTTTGQIYDEIKTGVKSMSFSKIEIFDPALDVSFTPGRHGIILPDGIRWEWGQINLLHFKNIGRDYFIRRSTERWKSWGFSEQMVSYRVNKGLRLMDGKLEKIQKIL